MIMSTYFLNSFPGLSRRDDKKIYTIENKEQQRKLEHGQDNGLLCPPSPLKRMARGSRKLVI